MRKDVSQGRTTRRRAWRRMLTVAATVVFAVPLSMALLAAPSSTLAHASVSTSETRLDNELYHAEHDLGIPPSLLTSVTALQALPDEGSTSVSNAQAIDARNALLYERLKHIERLAPGILHDQTQTDINTYTSMLLDRHAEDIPQVSAYQAELDQMQTNLAQAKSPGDYVKLDQLVVNQTFALNTLLLTYHKLESFQAFILALPGATLDASLANAWYAHDQQQLNATSTASGYAQIEDEIDQQELQLEANQSSAMSTSGPALLSIFQKHIDALQADGQKVTPLRQAAMRDAHTLASAKQPRDYLALSQTLTQQSLAMELPLLHAQADQQLHTLSGQIAAAQQRSIVDPFSGARYPAAYEYASGTEGIGIVQQEVKSANTVYEMLNAEHDIATLSTNLQAMLTNMADKTPYNKAHKMDLQLLSDYGLTQGKVIVVSLREQAARFYDNSKLVYASYVTTGAPALPSPPGLHYAMEKDSPTIFLSSEPKGSPYYFEPTHINYAILYHDGGDFLHDAWWRNQFGPGTELPHYDPAAFNGGSHGCVNFDKAHMAWVYAWTPLGTPILVY